MKEFKGKTSKDLIKVLIEKRNALQAFRLGNAGSKTKNVKEGRGLKKDIARIMTELTVLSKTEVKEVKPKAVAKKAPARKFKRTKAKAK